MIYGKKKLMKHFQEEIDRVASLELKALQEQKEMLKAEAIEAETLKLETEFKQRYRKKSAQLEKQYANLKAQFDTASKNEIYQCRKSFQENIAQKVMQQLQNYAQSEDYVAQLEQKFTALKDVVVYVGQKDENHLTKWKAAYPTLNFEVSPFIRMGGYQVFDEASHVRYDYTLDAQFESEMNEFMTKPLSVLKGGAAHE